ncbi:hypothetical protein ASE13_18905 [Sphingomonas sp. Root241]|nr:hypothetical protein ASE13_18905 [Sphingomonas sp. Root241]
MCVAAATAAQASGPAHTPAASTSRDPIFGSWTNPSRTIVVKTLLCGSELCGAIVAADAEAQNDAREAGVEHLIGTELLQNYRKTGSGRWTGTVFVPDMARSFTSHIVQRSPDVLRISGCILGGLICKSQDWTRI